MLITELCICHIGYSYYIQLLSWLLAISSHWGCSLVVVQLPSMQKALGPIPNTANSNKFCNTQALSPQSHKSTLFLWKHSLQTWLNCKPLVDRNHVYFHFATKVLTLFITVVLVLTSKPKPEHLRRNIQSRVVWWPYYRMFCPLEKVNSMLLSITLSFSGFYITTTWLHHN